MTELDEVAAGIIARRAGADLPADESPQVVDGVASALLRMLRDRGKSPRKERAFTAKNWQIAKAPKRITLLGDRRKPEPATHIIEFPGGAIELSRIGDGEYWAHIIVNRGWALEEIDGLRQTQGQVVDSRVFVERVGLREVVPDLDERGEISQIAVLIRSGA